MAVPYPAYNTRFPTPGSDSGTWGYILENFLSISIFNDPADPTNVNGLNGTLTTNAIKAAGAVTTVNSKSPVSGAVTLAASDLSNGVTGSGATVLATSPTLVTPTLGAATATTINKLTVTAPASGSTLTVADGKTLSASNTLTLAGTDSTTITFQGTDTYVGRTTTDKLTNKAIVSRTAALTDAATITPNCDTTDIATVTIAGNRTFANPTGTPGDGQKLLLRVTQDATGSRTLAFGTSYKFGTDIPSITLSTTAGATDYIGFVYNLATTHWDVVVVVKGY